MAVLMVLYNKPADPAAFDKHYFEKHIPLAKKIPGLRRYEVNQGPVATPEGPSPYHLVALLLRHAGLERDQFLPAPIVHNSWDGRSFFDPPSRREVRDGSDFHRILSR